MLPQRLSETTIIIECEQSKDHWVVEKECKLGTK